MTTSQIVNEIEQSKTQWGPVQPHLDNPKHAKVLAVAAEFAILSKNEGHEYIIQSVEFPKYINNTITPSKKGWKEIINHDYLKVIVQVHGIGAIQIYEDIEGNICLDQINSFKKGYGTTVMNWFLDTIELLGLQAVTVPTCIDNGVFGMKKIYIKTMGLRNWAIDFGWKANKNTPKLYYR